MLCVLMNELARLTSMETWFRSHAKNALLAVLLVLMEMRLVSSRSVEVVRLDVLLVVLLVAVLLLAVLVLVVLVLVELLEFWLAS